MKLVFASNNAHKLEEVRKIMPAGVEIVSLHEIGFEQEIEETGETLEENSLIKAKTVWEWMKGLEDERGSGLVDGVFADDTGLEITALGGQPGVYSARWAGSPEANRQKAIRELAGKEDRSARFRTVITLLMNGDAPLNGGMMQVEGEVRGWITEEEHGAGGFGYDPIFIPEGYDKTFGELPSEVKNSISHRARALQALVKILSAEH